MAGGGSLRRLQPWGSGSVVPIRNRDGAASSSRTERIIARTETGRQRTDTRFVVTDLSGRSKAFYEKVHCRRGRAENHIEAWTTHLAADRTSCSRDLVAPGETTANSVTDPQMTSRTNAAAFVAEGNLKPQSDLGFALVTAPVQTLAHSFVGSR